MVRHGPVENAFVETQMLNIVHWRFLREENVALMRLPFFFGREFRRNVEQERNIEQNGVELTHRNKTPICGHHAVADGTVVSKRFVSIAEFLDFYPVLCVPD